MKLKDIVTFSGEIRCLSGLHIGGVSNSLDIGGIDQEVIKNPLTNEPYIPGSSLKGKMRSELEHKYGAFRWDKKKNAYIESEEEPCGCGRKECMICTIFGAHRNPNAKSAPTRIIVRDAILSKTNIDSMLGNLERKTENIISRKFNKADSPRTIERVVAGTSFKFEIVLRIFEGDNQEKMINYVKEGLELVEKSYLGGLGSRGSGHVKIEYTMSAQSDKDVQDKADN